MTRIEKPWGCEEILEINEKYMVKRLTMNKGHRCSLQYHNYKMETIYVLSGVLRIYSGSTPETLEAIDYTANEFVTIEPKYIHRMEAVETSVYLEASLPDDGNDVVRISDDYNR
ncbi:MAG: hypothetical protein JXR25_04945 [Pontiellaceae bacterium]|nr:hypothetical protein [Pontiellaceae bacterium]MBN2784154.1 hypothetical protein [Pontiellaceae bacterium]